MKQLTNEARDAQFEAWWESSGQFCRSGGGAYEKTFAYTAWLAAIDTAQPVQVNAMRGGALDAALVYVAHMGHGTPQHMCPKGVTLFDADGVEVKLPDGRVVHAGRTPEYLRNKALTAAQQAQPERAPSDDTEFFIGVCEGLDEMKRRDAAFEAVRRKLTKLPRYSFHLHNGNVRRVEEKIGNWIEFDMAHRLFDPVAVDAAIKQGGQQAKQAQPERGPLTQTQVVEAFCELKHNTQYVSVFDAGVRYAERYHGIKQGGQQ